MSQLTADQQRAEITRVLREGNARMEADNGGPALEWPLLLSSYVHEALCLVLGAQMTRSHLIALLVQADNAQKATAPGADWPSWYAGWLHARYQHNRPGTAPQA